MIWLPYESFQRSAASLDSRTLTVQRFDTFRLLNALTKNTAVSRADTSLANMWRDHKLWLACYGAAVCLEWERQAEQPSNMTDYFHSYLANVADITDPYPRWLGDSLLHLSHRSNMIRLAPEHYMQLWPGVNEGMPLAWPVEGEEDDRLDG